MCHLIRELWKVLLVASDVPPVNYMRKIILEIREVELIFIYNFSSAIWYLNKNPTDQASNQEHMIQLSCSNLFQFSQFWCNNYQVFHHLKNSLDFPCSATAEHMILLIYFSWNHFIFWTPKSYFLLSTSSLEGQISQLLWINGFQWKKEEYK